MTYLQIADVTSRLLGTQYYDNWIALTVDQQNKGIVRAQRRFEALSHQGVKYDIEQDLMYPRNVCGFKVEINDDMLEGLAIESYYQGSSVKRDTELIMADENIIEEWQDDTKVVYASAIRNASKYLFMGFKSLEACELIYPWLSKTARY